MDMTGRDLTPARGLIPVAIVGHLTIALILALTPASIGDLALIAARISVRLVLHPSRPCVCGGKKRPGGAECQRMLSAGPWLNT
jgi:hypothetical protein